MATACLFRRPSVRSVARTVACLAVVSATLALPTRPGAPAPAQETPQDDLPVVQVDRLPLDVQVRDIDWLSGDWITADTAAGASRWEAVYGSPSGDHLLSASKELRKGQVVTFDYEHFYERDGAVRMRPYPSGRASVEFTLTAYSEERRRAVFENPDHDFPRRFVYHRTADDALVIELSGEMGGQTVEMRLDMQPRIR